MSAEMNGTYAAPTGLSQRSNESHAYPVVIGNHLERLMETLCDYVADRPEHELIVCGSILIVIIVVAFSRFIALET